MMKKTCLFTIVLCLLGFISAHAQPLDPRADSLDISHYTIALDITDFAGRSISGSAELDFTSKVNGLAKVNLDLLALPVSSVTLNGENQNFSYNDTLLSIQLSNALNQGATGKLKITYAGQPKRDPSGWGGFYFTGDYAFNLGVGFETNPHNFGRAWFPCLDNFVDRATYEFFITTSNDKRALCNGLLQKVEDNPDNTRTWHWKLDQTIPTYLAAVAVAPYELVEFDHAGVNGTIPVILAGVASDTTNMKTSFAKMATAIETFEEKYGAHEFSRIGFNLVPFNGGAMEHATNIAYPRFGAAGNLDYESLWAHELAHHWWGDLITCNNAEEMWLNEGWASYSEAIFMEAAYGAERYKEYVRDNHRNVLQFAHFRDGRYRAVQGTPHDYTYGMHVYDKGADVAHTLRGYMGDEDFFKGIRSFLNTYAFKDVTSADFRDHLSGFTNTDMTAFFSNWVYNKGFSHFSIESFSQQGTTLTLNLKQELRGADFLYSNVPLEVTFYDANWQKEVQSVVMSDATKTFTLTLPAGFTPVFVALDMEEKISDATTDQYQVISSSGNYPFGDALMTVDVSSISDSALVRVEHSWVGADSSYNNIPDLYISDYRYWTLDGVWPGTFEATAQISYDGRAPAPNSSFGFLDHTLIRQTEDSLVLVYRPNATAPWQIYDHYIVNTGSSKNDRQGSVTITQLQKGQYAFAMYDQTLSSGKAPQLNQKELTVYPNPAEDTLNITFEQPTTGGEVFVYDRQGKEVISQSYQESSFVLNTTDWKTGGYILLFVEDNQQVASKRVVVRH